MCYVIATALALAIGQMRMATYVWAMYENKIEDVKIRLYVTCF